jgi:RNA polymerase sigma-70 factor (ECF subfamily)
VRSSKPEAIAIVQRDLVERAQRGDREAFGVLAAASIGQLYNLAQLMLADADLASDAVQEALIAAWRDLRALRDPDSFRAWLDRVLVRCIYRAAGRERRQVALRQLLPAVEDSAPDPARTLETRDTIHRAFRGLSAEHRAVLVAHHYLELADDEAARMLDIPSGTYKSRLHRATAAMRGELDADARRGEPLSAGAIR